MISAVQSQVTGVEVKPSKYRPARHIALFVALFVVSIAGFLGMHVTGQFSLPASRLAPNFPGSHYLVAGSFLAGLIVLLTGMLANVGANVLTVLSLILLSGAFHFWSSSRLPQTESMSRWNKIATLLLPSSVVLLPLAVLASLFKRPMLVEDFLMSGHVLIPLSFIAAAAWLLRLSYHNLETRLAVRLERGIPATLSFQDMQAASLALRANQAGQSPKHLQVEIGWKVPVIAKAVLAMTPFWIMLQAFGNDDGGQGLAVVCFGAFVLSVYLIGVKWWKEMPYLASATARPPNRVGHVDRLMRGIAKDLADLAPLFIASVIAISLVGGLRLEGIGYRVVSGALVVSSVSLAVYAAILWIIAIRSIFGVIVLTLVCYIPCSMMTMAFVIPDGTFATSWKALGIMLSACVISAFAVAGIMLARRYFHRVEWARFV